MREKLKLCLLYTSQYAVCELLGRITAAPVQEAQVTVRKGEPFFVLLETDLILDTDAPTPETAAAALLGSLGVVAHRTGKDYLLYYTIGGYNAMWQMQKPRRTAVCGGSVYSLSLIHILLLGKVGGVAVQCVHNAGNKTVRCGAAGLRRRADLPLQGLFVGVGVDVRLLQKAERHTAVIQRFVQGAALLGAAAHAGNTVKHDGIPGLYNVCLLYTSIREIHL